VRRTSVRARSGGQIHLRRYGTASDPFSSKIHSDLEVMSLRWSLGCCCITGYAEVGSWCPVLQRGLVLCNRVVLGIQVDP